MLFFISVHTVIKDLLKLMNISTVAADNNSKFTKINGNHSIKNLNDQKVTTSSKSNSDLVSKNLIENFETTILPRWQEKYKLNNTTTKTLKFVTKNFLDDHNLLRIICALGNEVAVALTESMRQWKFPQSLTNTLFYGLWGVSVGSCGARATLRGLGTESLKPFLESSIQDGIAAILGPTGVVMIANKVQDLIYNRVKIVPQSAINFVRPIISVTLAEKAIPKILDPLGKKVGALTSKIIPEETYNKYSQSISNKLQKRLNSKHAVAA